MAKFIAIYSSIGLGFLGVFASVFLLLINPTVAISVCLPSIYFLGLGYYLKGLESRVASLEKSIKQIIPPPRKNELSTERAGKTPALSSFFSLLVGI